MIKRANFFQSSKSSSICTFTIFLPLSCSDSRFFSKLAKTMDRVIYENTCSSSARKKNSKNNDQQFHLQQQQQQQNEERNENPSWIAVNKVTRLLLDFPRVSFDSIGAASDDQQDQQQELIRIEREQEEIGEMLESEVDYENGDGLKGFIEKNLSASCELSQQQKKNLWFVRTRPEYAFLMNLTDATTSALLRSRETKLEVATILFHTLPNEIVSEALERFGNLNSALRKAQDALFENHEKLACWQLSGGGSSGDDFVAIVEARRPKQAKSKSKRELSMMRRERQLAQKHLEEYGETPFEPRRKFSDESIAAKATRKKMMMMMSAPLHERESFPPTFEARAAFNVAHFVDFIPSFFIPMELALQELNNNNNSNNDDLENKNQEQTHHYQYTEQHLRQYLLPSKAIEIVSLPSSSFSFSSSSSSVAPTFLSFIRLHGCNASFDMSPTVLSTNKRFERFDPNPEASAPFLEILQKEQQKNPREQFWMPLRKLLELAGKEAEQALPYQGPEALLFFAQLQHKFAFSPQNGGMVALAAPRGVLCLDMKTTPCPCFYNQLFRAVQHGPLRPSEIEKGNVKHIPREVLKEMQNHFSSWADFAVTHRDRFSFLPSPTEEAEEEGGDNNSEKSREYVFVSSKVAEKWKHMKELRALQQHNQEREGEGRVDEEPAGKKKDQQYQHERDASERLGLLEKMTRVNDLPSQDAAQMYQLELDTIHHKLRTGQWKSYPESKIRRLKRQIESRNNPSNPLLEHDNLARAIFEYLPLLPNSATSLNEQQQQQHQQEQREEYQHYVPLLEFAQNLPPELDRVIPTHGLYRFMFNYPGLFVLFDVINPRRSIGRDFSTRCVMRAVPSVNSSSTSSSSSSVSIVAPSAPATFSRQSRNYLPENALKLECDDEEEVIDLIVDDLIRIPSHQTTIRTLFNHLPCSVHKWNRMDRVPKFAKLLGEHPDKFILLSVGSEVSQVVLVESYLLQKTQTQHDAREKKLDVGNDKLF